MDGKSGKLFESTTKMFFSMFFSYFMIIVAQKMCQHLLNNTQHQKEFIGFWFAESLKVLDSYMEQTKSSVKNPENTT